MVKEVDGAEDVIWYDMIMIATVNAACVHGSRGGPREACVGRQRRIHAYIQTYVLGHWFCDDGGELWSCRAVMDLSSNAKMFLIAEEHGCGACMLISQLNAQ